MTHYLRVIAGSARGRRLLAPRGDAIRPTTGRVKEAVFSALTARDRLVDACVLDLYAGTGALAIESLSRAAARAVLVERDRDALEALRHNLEATDGARAAAVVPTDAVAFLHGVPPRDAPFDLVFCDPPYDVDDDAVNAALAPLAGREWTTADALIVVERPVGAAAPEIAGMTIDWERKFGDTLVFFLSA